MRANKLAVAFVALLANVGCPKEPDGDPDASPPIADAASMRPSGAGGQGGGGGATAPDSGPDRQAADASAPSTTPDGGPTPIADAGAGATRAARCRTSRSSPPPWTCAS
jgi:hypothetical protein